MRPASKSTNLQMVALSSAAVHIDPALEAEENCQAHANAKFVHDVGGLYLQLTDERPKDRAITAADYNGWEEVISEIGKRSAISEFARISNHMGSLESVPKKWINPASHDRAMPIGVDVAHYFQGGATGQGD